MRVLERVITKNNHGIVYLCVWIRTQRLFIRGDGVDKDTVYIVTWVLHDVSTDTEVDSTQPNWFVLASCVDGENSFSPLVLPCFVMLFASGCTVGIV